MHCTITLSIFATVVAISSRLCVPFDNSLRPYTGFRVFRRYSYGWPVLHTWQVVHCKRGSVDLCEYFPAQRGSNFNWNETVCLASDRCFRFARRKRFALRELPVFAANTFVGGIYLENGQPLLPIYASSPQNSFIGKQGRRVVSYVPMFYTPDVESSAYPEVTTDGTPDWIADLDPFEQYNFTQDATRLWMRVNAAVNYAARHLEVSERYIPWEFDAAARELSKLNN